MAEVRYRCLNPDCGRYESFLDPADVVAVEPLGELLYHDYERQGTLLDPAVGRDNVTRLPGTEAEPFPLPCGPVQQLDGPCRIRLRRTKGWRKPDDVINVARPTKWGNPFTLHDYTDSTRENVVEWHRRALLNGTLRTFRGRWGAAQQSHPVTVADVRRELRGHDLACYCRLEDPCHAQTYLTVANS